MNIRPFFKANSQTAKLVKPTIRAFNDPSKCTQAAAMFGVALGKHRSHTTPSQPSAMGFGVIGSITLNTVGATPTSSFAADFGNRIHQGHQLGYVMGVCAGQRGRKWDTVGVSDDMMLRSRFPAIRGIRTSLRPPKTALTDELSTIARDQSSCLASSSCCSNTQRIFSQTPAACQSRNRRQHVMPEHPISLGKYSQGMPVLSTKRMPVRTGRLFFGFRPGFRRRRFFGGGSSGSISSHSLSSKIGFAMTVPPCTGQYSKASETI